MNSFFSTDFFVANRQRLRKFCDSDMPIVITANGLLQRGADSTYAFAQDASFWYLTGLDEPDLVLIMDQEKEYLIVPQRDANRQAFDGAISDEALVRRSGVQNSTSADQGWQQLQTLVKKTKRVATIAAAPNYIEQHGMYVNPARAEVIHRLTSSNEAIEVIDISPHLRRMRMIKQAPELAAIQQAIDITAASITEAFRPAKLKKYAYEYEIEAELFRGFRTRGSTGHAFEPIIASGKRACTLHNIANNGSLAANDLIIMDVGAEVEHYAADISRTISLKQPSARQQAVHGAVLAVQRYAMDVLKPGVLIREYEQAIEQYMGKKLCELGLITSITHDNVRRYYPHATSHFLGLNVHDTGEYDRPLEAGSVITVEPGIYIPEEGIGVRIEDDVLITKAGITVLTDTLSREL